MEKICSKCGARADVVELTKYRYANFCGINSYQEASGKKWYGSICQSCRVEFIRKSRGNSSRENSKKPQVVAAVNAEKLAEEKFKSLGMEVTRVDFFGPDLICKLGQFTWTVEVKRAGFSSRRWRVGRVRKARKGDDLVALVLPNSRVYIDSMENHLKYCERSGTRTITSIVKEFGLDKTL